jgi:hypothetical protein
MTRASIEAPVHAPLYSIVANLIPVRTIPYSENLALGPSNKPQNLMSTTAAHTEWTVVVHCPLASVLLTQCSPFD